MQKNIGNFNNRPQEKKNQFPQPVVEKKLLISSNDHEFCQMNTEKKNHEIQ